MGRDQGPPCGIVSSSNIYVDAQNPLWLPESKPSKTIEISSSSFLRPSFTLSVFDKQNPLLRLGDTRTASANYVLPEDSLIVHRYISAASQWGQKEKFVVEIHNRGSAPLVARYVDSLPAFIKPAFHTLTIAALQDGSTGSTGKQPLPVCWREGKRALIQSVFSSFVPGVDWEISPGEAHRPAGLQVHMSLPAGQGLSITMEWRKTFLHYATYPPDPHRGFHVPSGVLLVSLPGDRDCFPNTTDPFLRSLLCHEATVYRYTEALLLSLPTPDFSTTHTHPPFNTPSATNA